MPMPPLLLCGFTEKLCAENRIDGVIHLSRVWLIPKDAKRPLDARRKENKAIML